MFIFIQMYFRSNLINLNNYFIANIRMLTLFLIIFSSCVLLVGGFLFHPAINGDGNEYVGMTISLFNHLSPDYRIQDAELKQKIYDENGITANLTAGYIASLKGTLEASHLWFYSLFVLPLFYLLHIFSLNELKAFQFFNIFLLIITMFVMYRYDTIIKPKHFWYIAICISSPVLLYIHWTHTEVFSFCFVTLSLFFGFLSDNKNYYLAVLFSSLASLQNPPLAVLSLALTLSGWRSYTFKIKSLICLIAISSISLLPYIYSYYFFHTTNPQMFIGAASFSLISWERVLGIFGDLNSGIIVYLPLILIISVILVPYSIIIQHDSRILFIWGIILALGFASTTTINWNCGMMYIFRYVVWIIPLLFVVVALITEYNSNYVVSLILLIALLSTGSTTVGCLMDHRGDNYLTFNQLSKSVMVTYPSLYNPDYEIFGERSLYTEHAYEKGFPYFMIYNNTIRKELSGIDYISLLDKIDNNAFIDQKKAVIQYGKGYINGDLDLSALPVNLNNVHIFAKNTFNPDIFDSSIQFIDYTTGWSQIKDENGKAFRWMENNGTFATLSPNDRVVELRFQGRSNSQNRTLNIISEGQIQGNIIVTPNQGSYAHEISLKKGLNIIQFNIPDLEKMPFWRTMERYPIIGFNNISISDQVY